MESWPEQRYRLDVLSRTGYGDYTRVDWTRDDRAAIKAALARLDILQDFVVAMDKTLHTKATAQPTLPK